VVSATWAILLHKALHAGTRSEKTREYGQASDPVSIVDVLHTRIIQHAASLALLDHIQFIFNQFKWHK
jgi:hypothetical protein